MAVRFVKKAEKSPRTGEDETRARVAEMLAEIEQGREAVARHTVRNSTDMSAKSRSLRRRLQRRRGKSQLS
ncbi:hypothetical protein ACO2I3_02355 [Leptospira interrogans]